MFFLYFSSFRCENIRNISGLGYVEINEKKDSIFFEIYKFVMFKVR